MKEFDINLKCCQEHIQFYFSLSTFDDFAAAAGIEYWIDMGTLFGAVKLGTIVRVDYDTDIGMMLPAFKRLLLHRQILFDLEGDGLMNRGKPEDHKAMDCHSRGPDVHKWFPFRFYEEAYSAAGLLDTEMQGHFFSPSGCIWGDYGCVGPSRFRPCADSISSTGSDIYPYMKAAGRIFPASNWRERQIPRGLRPDWIEPLTKCKLGILELPCPARAKEVAQVKYGAELKGEMYPYGVKGSMYEGPPDAGGEAAVYDSWVT